MKEIPKAVIDTNVFISALIGSKNAKYILDNFLDGRFDIIISEKLFEELIATIGKEKFSKIIDEKGCRELIELLKTDADWAIPEEKIAICRDPKDNIVLECAVAGKVGFIVTGDRDLLALSPFRKISIITPSKFLGLL